MREQKSYYATPSDTEQQWFIVDAKDQILGRTAAFVASILRGKHNPKFTPSMDTGEFVVICNAEKIKVTGNKLKEKKYYTHSRYPGGLKEISLEHLLEKKPEHALYKAIEGMLPKNRLGRKLLTKVKIYAGGSHDHEAQNPKPLSVPK
ncbi:MAG: large subunit ribosomal protein L13 [Candidatus Marinamargulisbacteria bacterium]|jgi:large subunit ribosomal protein L13